ncbi:MAG: ribonuclease catalytic domain-containing protein [Desulfovibrionaceae bacterium]
MAKPTLLTPTIPPGCLVEFMQGDQPQLAWVLENASGRCRLLTITKREVKLPEPRLLPWTGPRLDPAASRQEMLDALNEHHARRGELQASMDVMEVWELAQGEVPSAGVEWFAGLVWDAPGPDETAAMGRALLTAKTHFKFRPPQFEIYDAQTVEARLERQAREKARERVVSAGMDLFRELWNHRGPKPYADKPDPHKLDPDQREGLAALLRAQIGGGGDEDQNRIWAACTKGLPDDPHLALKLAKAWGIVSEHHNHLLDQAGYAFDDADWTPEHEGEIAAMRADFERLAALPDNAPEPTPYVSIDGASTRDIDDAFHIEREGDGYRLRLALARPTLAWEFGSRLDLAVLHRATSLYLPEGTSHMLPEALGVNLFSLLEGQARPALVAEFRLDADGNALSVEPSLSWVQVAENTTFDRAEEVLDAPGAPENAALAGQVVPAYELAGKLFARRLARGASVIERPDIDVELSEGPDGRTVTAIVEKPATPRASLLVSEFMILATAGLAGWARERGLPLLHRTQAIALPSEAKGVFSSPEDVFRVVKLLAPAILEVKPRPHAALAVDAYAPVTSPIRRYTDLVNCAQFQSWIETGAPRFTLEELERLAPALSSRLGAVGQVQRFRPRYWKLAHLAVNRKTPLEAVALEEGGQFPTLAVPSLQITLRVPRRMLGEKLYPGQRFELRLGRVDALTNELKVAEALEM